ncbi:hypothetical protein FACS1894186_7450 [Alphaproteobacteria bacterium]|nr:hypothetical protein FACS1894186_7450 [Alphaproteobacteria bacterium]
MPRLCKKAIAYDGNDLIIVENKYEHICCEVSSGKIKPLPPKLRAIMHNQQPVAPFASTVIYRKLYEARAILKQLDLPL